MLTADKTWNIAFIFHGVAFGMLPTLTTLYFVDDLKGSLLDFGVMSGVTTLFSILTSVYAGQLPERYGRSKPFIATSFLLSSGILFALTHVTNVLLFQILYILLGISNSIYPSAVQLFIAETYQRVEWSRMFAWHSLIVGLSNTLGLAICSIFVSRWGYRVLLFICVPLLFVSFLVALVVVNDPPIHVERWLNRIMRPIDDVESLSYLVGTKGWASRFKLKSTINMSLFGLGTFLFILAVSSTKASLPVFLSNVANLGPSTIFTIFFGRSLIGSTSYAIVGKLIGEGDGGNAVMFASIARAILVLLFPPIAFLPSLTLSWAVLLLSAMTFAWALYSVGSSTVITEYASEGSIGLYNALSGVGNVVGCLLSGLIPAMFNFNLLFTMASGMFFIAFLIFWKSIRRSESF